MLSAIPPSTATNLRSSPFTEITVYTVTPNGAVRLRPGSIINRAPRGRWRRAASVSVPIQSSGLGG
jgi:hypothetical protein